MGNLATTNGSTNSTAFGDHANGQGDNATALGSSAGPSNFGFGTTSVGAFANGGVTFTGDYSTAIGAGTSVATSASSFGSYSIAVGGGDGVAGVGAQSSGTRSIAIGLSSVASNTSAVAIGDHTTASGLVSTAIGAGASASANNSVAIGNGSVANVANTVSVGSVGNERRVTNVAAGVNPTDAVNFSQLTAVANNVGAAFQGQLAGLQGQVNDNQREARAGIALALAAGSLQFDNRPGKVSVAGAYGNFKGYSGLAVGVGYAVNDRLRFNATFSGTPDQNAYGGVISGSVTLN